MQDVLSLPKLNEDGFNEMERAFYHNMKMVDFRMIPGFLKNNILKEVEKFDL